MNIFLRWIMLTGILSLLAVACQTNKQVESISRDMMESLELISEKPVDNMPLGNLSGLTYCQNNWFAISDKDDKNIYQLFENNQSYFAKKIALPNIPKFSLVMLKQIRTIFSHTYLDFEGIACDQSGNLYIISEFYSQILKLSANLIQASWLELPDNFTGEAYQHNLLKRFNAKVEGIALSPDAQKIWLAAERDNRGIIYLQKINKEWDCYNCILLSESYLARSPKLLGSKKKPIDFSDIVFFKDKIFTLERLEHKICRRNPDTAQVEKCWSFLSSILRDEGMLYSNYPFGQAEALWLDDENVWVGFDNNNMRRNKDREIRPIIYHFKSPGNGWLN